MRVGQYLVGVVTDEETYINKDNERVQQVYLSTGKDTIRLDAKRCPHAVGERVVCRGGWRTTSNGSFFAVDETWAASDFLATLQNGQAGREK